MSLIDIAFATYGREIQGEESGLDREELLYRLTLKHQEMLKKDLVAAEKCLQDMESLYSQIENLDTIERNWYAAALVVHGDYLFSKLLDSIGGFKYYQKANSLISDYNRRTNPVAWLILSRFQMAFCQFEMYEEAENLGKMLVYQIEQASKVDENINYVMQLTYTFKKQDKIKEEEALLLKYQKEFKSLNRRKK